MGVKNEITFLNAIGAPGSKSRDIHSNRYGYYTAHSGECAVFFHIIGKYTYDRKTPTTFCRKIQKPKTGRAWDMHWDQEEEMETRIALIGIIVEDSAMVEKVNELLHQFRDYIVGRMGLPYREKHVNIISVVVDAPENKISALSGKLGMIKGINVKSVQTKA